jgi:hypothetical protein
MDYGAISYLNSRSFRLDDRCHKWIEVRGVKLQIKTFLSKDYHPEQYPWLADGDEDGNTAEFDIVSPLSGYPTDYRYRINLIDT